jgi:hypothetical protein
MKGVEEPIEICEVGEEGKARLRQPPDSEKAHRFMSADREPQAGRVSGRIPQSCRTRRRAGLSFVSCRLGKDRQVIASAAGAHGRRGHAQTTAETSRNAGALFASPIPGDRHHEFSGK